MVAPHPINLNADIGEGFDDAPLIALVSSVSIACGGHTGDHESMKRACRMALERGVTIGAHPSFRDRENYGRRPLEVDPAALRSQIAAQVQRLADAAAETGSIVSHVKPHGALYNMAAVRRDYADAIAETMAGLDPRMVLLAPPGSMMEEAARACDIPFVAEGFADRAYAPDGTLMPRSETGAVLSDPQAAAAQALLLAQKGQVVTAQGPIAVPCRSLCVHGDEPHAQSVAMAVREALLKAGLRIVSLPELAQARSA